jgi:hypothetical protein
MLGNRAYSARAHREHLSSRRIKTVIPEQSDQLANRRRRGSAGVGRFMIKSAWRSSAFRNDHRRRRSLYEQSLRPSVKGLDADVALVRPRQRSDPDDMNFHDRPDALDRPTPGRVKKSGHCA